MFVKMECSVSKAWYDHSEVNTHLVLCLGLLDTLGENDNIWKSGRTVFIFLWQFQKK